MWPFAFYLQVYYIGLPPIKGEPMGISVRASLVYGIDLGDPEHDEWNFKPNEDGDIPDPYEDNEDFEWDDLIAEFGAQKITTEAYGYGFAGTALSVGPIQNVWCSCEEVKVNMNVEPEGADTLREFVKFLDSKGLVLQEEYREPKWMLLSSYSY